MTSNDNTPTADDAAENDFFESPEAYLIRVDYIAKQGAELLRKLKAMSGADMAALDGAAELLAAGFSRTVDAIPVEWDDDAPSAPTPDSTHH